jgi:hypothetical protein
MGPAFYIMAILGCGEGEAACEPVGIVDTHYESVEACNEAAAAMIERHAGAPYPVVVAQCRLASSEVADKVLPSEIKLPEPQQQRQPPRFQRALFQPERLPG